MRILCVLLAGLVLAVCGAAETPRTWEQSGYDELDKGTLQKLSLRSDGRLMLAPRFRKIVDPALTYVWALAEDSRGQVYVGGGSPAKVIRINPSRDGESKPETLFESKDLEVHALAVDRDDNIYAATSPDPKVYKITRDGKSSVFFEPKAKYVWSLAFDSGGNLYVATGDKGELYQVDRKGQGKLLFNSEETHIRSIALDRGGNVIVGTEPGGLVLRVSPAGEGFVLFQTAKKEVTGVLVSPDGVIYAAAVGDRPPRAASTPSIPAPAVPAVVTATPPPSTGTGSVSGGSEVYRIDTDGAPRRLWSSRDDVVYALALRGGKLLLGTGNKGKITQLEGDSLHTTLVKAQATQVTAFLPRRDGALFAATSNIGGVQELGNGFEAEGSFESDVFDARNFTRWGRVFWTAETPQGTTLALFTRAGNADNPDRNWSRWAPVPARTNPLGGEASASPGARFLQWRAVLTTTSPQSTPVLDRVEIAYFPKNMKPAIEQVEATPAGYRFQTSPPPPATTPIPITLPPLGGRQSTTPPMRFDPPAQLIAQKGAQGVRWAAKDENDDSLVYSVFIRARDERNWKLLKEKVTDKFYWWDSTTFPDGTYYIRIVASDAPSNAEQDALTDQRESEPFEIDNTPPQIANLRSAREGGKVRVSFRATDAMTPIRKAEYAVDGSEWRLVLPTDQLADGLEEDYTFTIPDLPAGEHTIAVRVQDRVENLAVEKTLLR